MFEEHLGLPGGLWVPWILAIIEWFCFSDGLLDRINSFLSVLPKICMMYVFSSGWHYCASKVRKRKVAYIGSRSTCMIFRKCLLREAVFPVLARFKYPSLPVVISLVLSQRHRFGMHGMGTKASESRIVGFVSSGLTRNASTILLRALI